MLDPLADVIVVVMVTGEQAVQYGASAGRGGLYGEI